MKVRDDYLGSGDVPEHVTRNDLTRLVVAIRIVGEQYAQPVFYGDSRRNNEKATREMLGSRVTNRVDRLPSDQHRHDRCFAGTGRELQCRS